MQNRLFSTKWMLIMIPLSISEQQDFFTDQLQILINRLVAQIANPRHP